MALPDSWQEVALVTIDKIDETTSGPQRNMNFHAISETIDIAEGDYGFESIPTLSGGRVPKQTPQEDNEITLELYPVSLGHAGTTSIRIPDGLFQEWSGSIDTSQPLSNSVTFGSGVSRVRDLFRISVLWTDDAAVVNANQVIDQTTTNKPVALRYVATDCRMISHKAEFTDGILKKTVTFKSPAFNVVGTARTSTWESLNATTTPVDLPALGNYTS